MEVSAKHEGQTLTFFLVGELDHHGAKGLLENLEREIERTLPLSLVLDFSGVTFMDSSGIAVALRGWQRMRELGGAVTLYHVAQQPRKVFEASGVGRMVTIVEEGVHNMTRAENYVTLEFLSRSSNEGFARVAAAGFAAQLDPTLDELGDIKTAVSEAVTNAIVHAYPDQLGKVVMKLKILKGGMLEITIRDWGRGIENVEQARRPMYTTGGSERSGMGFTIMESFTDRLVVRSVPGKGTTVQMRKRIAPRLAVR